MNTTALAASVARSWDASIVPQLVEYIRIPAKSPHFDRSGNNTVTSRASSACRGLARQQPVRA